MTTRRRTENKKKKVVERRVIVGVEDMIMLTDTRDTGIVENLQTRLLASNIYTYIGHVLVVCNPYKWLPIYEKDVMKQYVHQARIDVAPHIFAVAEAAYRNMVTEEESQCVIISGESGAGKTEASKQIQAYIAEVSGGGESVDHIKRVFLESNPVLEAFGNAKTLRNNNSSRFGKYFELKFNHFGCPQGGLITNYLLEKSRVCTPGEGERNFHIFYQIHASSFCSKLLLSPPENHRNLSCSNCYTVDGINDAEEFDTTLEAMRAVGIGNSQIQMILSLVASIMHLANIEFRSQQVGDTEGSVVFNKDALNKFCPLAKLNTDLVEHVLTFRELQTMAAGGRIERYEVPQNPTQANARRDAICKSLYERLFNLIVSRINVALDPAAAESSDNKGLLSIGVLDIYGFEIFQNNGFEQLCINYVNEKLQQIFIELTLRSEQDEYQSEGITWTPIPFFNNRIVCDLLDAARPSGLFRILDDTCKTMHGTKANMDVDKKFLETTGQIHGSHPHFVKSTSSFTVKHYAGDVTYSCGKLGVANKDALGQDLVLLLKGSDDKLIKHLYPEEINLDDKKQPPTAGQIIRVQCNDLVAALMQCSPHYVRCIKSNDQKRALTIDAKRVQHQAKYLGLSENIKVRRAGFAYRAEYHRFLERFSLLSEKTYPEWRGSDKDGCKEIIKAIAAKIPGLNREEMQLGNTKIFIRHPETYFQIEKLREICLGDYVVRIQRAWRMYYNRKAYVSMQMEIAKLYKDAGKSRRRDSIFRPYQGDYLDSLAGRSTELNELKDAIFRIIDHYDVNENIMFADGDCMQLCSNNTAPLRSAIGHHSRTTNVPIPGAIAGLIQPRLIVLTNAALYVMERTVPEQGANPDGLLQPPTKSLPSVVLRRRIPLEKKVLQGATVTRHADNIISIICNPAAPLAAPKKDHWVEDNQVTHCPVTGKKFGLFARRHHCRISGGIYSEEVCNFRQLLPDFGYYEGPERVADAFIGLESIDILEDIVLFCDKKSELLGHLMKEWARINKSKLPITFSDQTSLRKAQVANLSRVPAASISFNSNSSIPDEGFSITTLGPSTINFSVPIGLSHAIVEQRQKNMAERRKLAEHRRKKEEAARRARQAAREEQREEERRIRQEQKRAQKAEAKAQLLRSQQEVEEKQKKVTPSTSRKFSAPANNQEAKAAAPTGGAGSELAAAMARRRAAAQGS